MWLFGDTFDGYASANFTRKWTTTNAGTVVGVGGISFTSAAGRHGSNGLRINAGQSGGSGLSFLPSITLPASGAVCIAGFSLAVSSLSDLRNTTSELDSSFGRIQLNGTTQIWFKMNSSGTISAFRSTTLLGTTVNAISAGQTSHIQYKVTIDPSSGEIKIRIDNVEETVFTGNTRVASTSTWNQIQLGAQGQQSAGSGVNWDYDDFYVLDGSGSFNNDFLGDLRGDALYPTADGANSGFTPNSGSVHYDRVNQTTPDDDTTYNSASTVAVKDTFTTQDAPVSGADIYAVQINLLAKKTDAGSAAVKGVARISGTDYLTSEAPIKSTYSYARCVFEQDPSGPTPWTDTVFNAAEFGYQKSS